VYLERVLEEKEVKKKKNAEIEQERRKNINDNYTTTDVTRSVRTETCSTVLREATLCLFVCLFVVCKCYRVKTKEEMRCLFVRPGCSDRLGVCTRV